MNIVSSRRPKARKKHHCMACGSWSIQPGDRYLTQFITDGGDAWHWKNCEPCDKIMAKVGTDYGLWTSGEGVDFETLCEWATDNPEEPLAISWRERSGV